MAFCCTAYVALWPIASLSATQWLGRFSNRPVGVKRFQTIHHHSVDVSRGLVLLFGIGTKALPSWDSKMRWNNLSVGLAVRRMAGPSDQTNSPHPSSREGHHSTARWSSSFLLSHLILYGGHAATTSRVQRNSVRSTQIRCMITASRRASATIAFFIPRCLAIFAVAGTQKALAFGLNPVMAVLLGMLTGVGGGMMRDLLLAEIPTVLRADLYAMAALAGATVVVIGDLLHIAPTATTIAGWTTSHCHSSWLAPADRAARTVVQQKTRLKSGFER